MTEKASIFKLILVIVLIVTTPLLFFRTVGDDPMKVTKENATKSIAIINEDIGVQEVDEEIRFGQDVTAILAEDSSFEWTVVGRSAGENGLRSLKYDAIVYLPSDFSQNIMTYNEENPVKTNFQFKVQSQLNAVNKEKVLVEIEKATKRVNQKITSLYWNYVSADMENIRQEFDEILRNEIAFQETMTAFYTPSSKNLAGHIDEQKEMLVNLQTSIQQVDEHAPEQMEALKAYEQNLASFVEYVEQYKEYQEKQQMLLAEIQAQSVQSVNKATENQQPLFAQSASLFEDQGSLLLENMSKLDSRMVSTQQMFKQLEEQRYSQVARQINEFYQFQEKILDFYQQLKDTKVLNDVEVQLVALSDRLSVGEEEEKPAELTDPIEPPSELEEEEQQIVVVRSEQEESLSDHKTEHTDGNSEKPESSGNPEQSFVDLESEKAALATISEDLIKVKEGLTSTEELLPEELEHALLSLDGINDRILALQSSLSAKETGEGNPLEDDLALLTEELDKLKGDFAHLKGINEGLEKAILEKDEQIKMLEDVKITLEDNIKKLEGINSELESELNLYKDYEGNIKAEIKKKEQSILASNALSQTRKDLLTSIFSKEIKSKDLVEMMYYYSYLDRYQSTLNGMLAENTAKAILLGNETLQQEAKKIVEISSEEKTGWDQIGEDMPTTQDALYTLEDGFTVFMAEYRQTIDEQQAALMESLEAIEQEAIKILNQIDQPGQLLTVVEPASTVEGEEMILGSGRISEQMVSIHTWMDSIKESQSSIIDYTGELQGRVNDVQTDADQLNSKWSKNVVTTGLIRDDVYKVLGNTFVDGQSNGYVYDFLTNPLKVSGDLPEETQSTNVKHIPPVVVLFIVLICSLLIGYASYYFKQPPLWIQAILFVLLNVIVGLVISLYGLDIYPLREESAVEWTVFTLLLLTAGSALIRVAFSVHHLVGLFATVGMVIFYVTPLLALTTPNFSFTDPMSEVYMSIQYGSESLFTQAAVILGIIVIGLGGLQYFIDRSSMISVEKESETYDA